MSSAVFFSSGGPASSLSASTNVQTSMLVVQIAGEFGLCEP